MKAKKKSTKAKRSISSRQFLAILGYDLDKFPPDFKQWMRKYSFTLRYPQTKKLKNKI
jgi:hypothetical protein